MRELSLFTGSGGGLIATSIFLGIQTIGMVEYNEYCQKVLQKSFLKIFYKNKKSFTKSFLKSEKVFQKVF